MVADLSMHETRISRMLREVESPSVVRSWTAHYSMSFDATQYRTSTAVELGVPLLASLRSASQKRQAEFVAGRYCAIRAMRRLGWAGEVELSVGLNYPPLWPAGMVGSITHTANFVSAAVASTRDLRSVGIDSETVMNRKIMHDIGNTVLCDDERDLCGCELGLGQEAFVTLVFSAKESIFKCLFPVVNVFFEFSDAEIFAIDVRTGDFHYRLLKDLSPEFRTGYIGSGRFELSQPHVHTGVELGWR